MDKYEKEVSSTILYSAFLESETLPTSNGMATTLSLYKYEPLRIIRILCHLSPEYKYPEKPGAIPRFQVLPQPKTMGKKVSKTRSMQLAFLSKEYKGGSAVKLLTMINWIPKRFRMVSASYLTTTEDQKRR